MADIDQVVLATPELQLFSTPPEILVRDFTRIPFARIVHHGAFATTDAGSASALQVSLLLPLQENSVWELVRGQLNLTQADLGEVWEFEAARLQGSVQIQADGQAPSTVMIPFTSTTHMDFHGADRTYIQCMVPGLAGEWKNVGVPLPGHVGVDHFPIGLHSAASWPVFVFSTGSKDDVGTMTADYWFEWLGYTVEQNNQYALHSIVATV